MVPAARKFRGQSAATKGRSRSVAISAACLLASGRDARHTRVSVDDVKGR
jgi:hypothetical protein